MIDPVSGTKEEDRLSGAAAPTEPCKVDLETPYVALEEDLKCLEDYFLAALDQKESKSVLLRLWKRELGVIRSRKDQEIVNDAEILLEFDCKEIVDGIKLTCRRKGIDLEQYIIDNFEWDQSLHCMNDCGYSKKITPKICEGCDYIDGCPDKKVKE